MAVYPIPVVVSDAWKSDHLPADHILVAAVDRIREEAFRYIFQECVEKTMGVDFVELGLAGFDLLQYIILLVRRKLREGFTAVARLAVFIETRQALSIKLCMRNG